jgi:hypothetical protein
MPQTAGYRDRHATMQLTYLYIDRYNKLSLLAHTKAVKSADQPKVQVTYLVSQWALRKQRGPEVGETPLAHPISEMTVDWVDTSRIYNHSAQKNDPSEC